MNRYKIILDGITLSESDFKADKVVTTETFENKKANSQEFTFRHAAYDVIKEKIIDNPEGRLVSLNAQIVDTCCGTERVILDGEIQGKNVDFSDGKCEARASILEKNRFLDCLKTYIVGEGLEDIRHPNIPMNKEVSDFEDIVAKSLQILLVYLVQPIVFTILVPVLFFLTIVEVIIQGIDIFLDELRGLRIGFSVLGEDVSIRPFGWVPDIIPSSDRDILPDISDFTDIMSGFASFLMKLDQVYWYPSPYIRTIIENACQQCGQQNGESYSFSSSIFNSPNSPYYRTVWLNASSERGRVTPPSVGLINGNSPIKTASDFMDDLVKFCNGKWEVIGNTLFLERRDFFEQGDSYDLTGEDADYSFKEEDIPARAWIRYTDDAIDLAGNAESGRMDRLINWNEPENPRQRGKKEYLIPFGRSLIGPYKSIFSETDSILGNIGLGLENLIGFNIPTLNLTVLKMSQLQTSVPKILIVDANEKLIAATDLDAQVLYDRFFSIDNPRSSGYKSLTFKVEKEMDCEEGIAKGDTVTISRGRAVAITVEKDWDSRKVTISGEI